MMLLMLMFMVVVVVAKISLSKRVFSHLHSFVLDDNPDNDDDGDPGAHSAL